MDSLIELRVCAIHHVALNVKAFELKHPNERPLPPFTAGSHIDVYLGNGLSRSYSLLNSPEETNRYVIAVHRSPTSAGGSSYMHEEILSGDFLKCTSPKNHFPLEEIAASFCFIAGGIGVTPMLSMIHRAIALGKPWELHYCTRTRQHAAYLNELQSLTASSHGRLHTYFDQEPEGNRLDLAALASGISDQTHLYCCGPTGMLEAFESVTHRIRDRAHVEYFGAKEAAARDGGYTVELAKSGLTLTIPQGKSILDIVLDAGIPIRTSCREGICGSCETAILHGEADHRDALLSDQERKDNKSMMICCSGSKGPLLVLDL